ncbi:DUF3035 domain-containing protein [Sandaracinobacteroides saxicola]|uniref:DUF3035 domain-containing protein n=1 Tax=Sandaracinobacteroides saxicola TaxID=2759707 RepID=A0A7G5ILD7_9SPHN|nr:DUF3035 domain-containing protein [Sandaracinobacteroides saxicola]QMW24179.1 DUF3035 domain-containing protein [Sandaracinobacteroides saxicola]
MTKVRISLGLGAACLMLSACASGGIADRKRPDEFAVGRSAPLVVPPEFTLAPPRPGAPRPLAADSQTQALEALFGPGVVLPPKSESEKALLEGAKATKADPMIRNNAGDPKTIGVDKGAFLRELLDAPAGTRNAATAKVTVGG